MTGNFLPIFERLESAEPITTDHLAKMDFGDDKPSVNCMTCHRGEREPMMAMRAAMRPPGGPGGPGGPPPERR